MAEESAQEKTEQPTPRRVTKAREDGQIPRSQELGAAIIVLAGAGVLATFGGTMLGGHASKTLHQAAGWLAAEPLTATGAATLVQDITVATLIVLMPVLAMVVAPSVFAAAIQAQGVMAIKPITPQLDRINPVKGFGRIFSPDSLVTLVKAIVKLTVLGLLTWLAISGSWDAILTLTGADAAAVADAVGDSSRHLLLYTGLAFLGIAGADYGWQVLQHQKKLRMTRQEIVQEHREMEGDPLLKSRMKSLAQSMARKRMLSDVKTADVVVVNPTSIAVAIKYDGDASSAPIIVAMGQRRLADQIRALAGKHGVPIMRNIPVARALISTGKIGQPIPAALYAAVAEVLAFIYRQRGKLPGSLADRRNG